MLVINKTDLAQHGEVDLDQMIFDATAARNGARVLALSRKNQRSVDQLSTRVRCMNHEHRNGRHTPTPRPDGTPLPHPGRSRRVVPHSRRLRTSTKRPIGPGALPKQGDSPMERNPRDDPATNEPDNQADEQLDRTARDSQASDPTVHDDGSVPEKQIQRWKDEGGSYHTPRWSRGV
jgi:hypothetical protein